MFLFFALFSGSIGNFIFEGLSGNLADRFIKNHSTIDTVDSRIDNALYLVKQMELKIEKLRTLFSPDKPDETKFQKTENHYVRTSVFDTLSSVFRVIFIIIFYIIGFFLLLAGVMLKLVDRNMSLRKRVAKLEKAVFKNDLLIIENAD